MFNLEVSQSSENHAQFIGNNIVQFIGNNIVQFRGNMFNLEVTCSI